MSPISRSQGTVFGKTQIGVQCWKLHLSAHSHPSFFEQGLRKSLSRFLAFLYILSWSLQPRNTCTYIPQQYKNCRWCQASGETTISGADEYTTHVPREQNSVIAAYTLHKNRQVSARLHRARSFLLHSFIAVLAMPCAVKFTQGFFKKKKKTWFVACITWWTKRHLFKCIYTV